MAIIGQFCMYMAVRDWKLIGDFEMEAAAVGRQFFKKIKPVLSFGSHEMVLFFVPFKKNSGVLEQWNYNAQQMECTTPAPYF